MLLTIHADNSAGEKCSLYKNKKLTVMFNADTKAIHSKREDKLVFSDLRIDAKLATRLTSGGSITNGTSAQSQRK